jgi:ABC-type nitrate/sulfonate/bicarbonate transport system substrate-binding protein
MRLDSTTIGSLRDIAQHNEGALGSLTRTTRLHNVNILLSNNLTAARYPAIVARELGLFEKVGLRINYFDSGASVDFVELLLNKSADVVMLDAPQTLQAASKRQPIASVYETMQSAPEVLAVVVGGPIGSLADLKGQTIGLASDRDLATARLVLDTAGIDIQDVTTVVVGDRGADVAKAIEQKRIVAYAAGVRDTTVLRAFGISMRDLTPPWLKINPANTFTVLKSRMEELRPLLEKFLRAWAMATRAAKLDPERVSSMCRAAVPEEWTNADAGQALMDAAIYLNSPVTEAFGDLERDVWAGLQPLYRGLGLIDADTDPASFLDRSLIAAANDFNDADVLAALAGKPFSP